MIIHKGGVSAMISVPTDPDYLAILLQTLIRPRLTRLVLSTLCCCLKNNPIVKTSHSDFPFLLNTKIIWTYMLSRWRGVFKNTVSCHLCVTPLHSSLFGFYNDDPYPIRGTKKYLKPGRDPPLSYLNSIPTPYSHISSR